MKQLLISMLVVFALLALAACSSPEKKAEATAGAFLSAVEQQDFESAKGLVTKESEGMLSIIEGFVTSTNKDDLGSYQHNILSTVVEGDTARVSYETWTKDSPDTKETQELKLIKTDGDWKVSLEKGNFDK